MKRMNVLSIGILLSATLAIPTITYASYVESDAKHDCKRAIKSDDRYTNFYDIHIEDQGHYSYKVSGKVRSEGDNRKHWFDCQIRHGEVTSWHVNLASAEFSPDDDSNKAAVIGAGLLGIAVITAIASHDDDKDHDRKRDSYNSGTEGNPFDDMSFLEKQCKRELRRHLDHDHGNVYELKFTHVDLHQRKLLGGGQVSFKSGGNRELSFGCEFDRSGRVHDGHYHYRQLQDH